MSYDKNAFKATNDGPHEDFDFIAYPGDKTTWAPKWGFVTTTTDPGATPNPNAGVFPRGKKPLFRWGGSFGGWVYGAAAHGGSPDDSGNVGPQVNSYSDFAGVFGTGVYVGGVAGTSTNNVGVYGQTGDTPEFPETIAAGVFGVGNDRWGVAGWNGVVGWAYATEAVGGVSVHGTGVTGLSDESVGVSGHSGNDVGVIGVSDLIGPPVPNASMLAGVWGSSATRHGVIGTSNGRAGVVGYSETNIGVFGKSGPTGYWAGWFEGNVGVVGSLTASVKNAVVPFPDGSQRVLHCMESPEHWFEDFGSAKLARGRAVVKLDANFAKVIKRGDYRVFVTPEGDCRGLYVRRKSTNNFEVRELAGGKSGIAFSYRIVGRRKDIKQHRRFAKFADPMPLPTRPARAPRKRAPTPAGLRAFVARVEKEALKRAPKGVVKARARMRAKASAA
jgi:hypothetical protein